MSQRKLKAIEKIKETKNWYFENWQTLKAKLSEKKKDDSDYQNQK